ncbi:hypothetical protein SeMB42_g03589 [Synchytrium endobioticum]|uniref:GCF C-terminal domain-containing protein n=1 Tax=Synchytrium endobioticum TaxID=286115 RepID=A0A507CP62_9FUNG|nr:hypothetical protein SeLEV6574_g06347 [Synchytrium endobioticum]TPX46709.1 hypothetical protein SeMB42_g03589 [Synchytrium endobioticum]
MNFGKGASKKNARRKVVATADDEDDAAGTIASPAPNQQTNSTKPENVAAVRLEHLDISGDAARKSAGSKTGLKTSVLSFGVDEDEDGREFKVKKSAASRRMAHSKVNQDSTPDLDCSVTPRLDYSQAGLEALKKSQLNRPQSAVADTDMGTDSNAAPQFPAVMDDAIPDAAAIFAARKLREQKRNDAAGVGAGKLVGLGSKSGGGYYISLDAKESEDADDQETAASSTKMESRLVTEEQDGDGAEPFEDYEGDTITFGAAAVKEAEAKRKQQFQAELIEAQDDEDDAGRIWEEEQLRRVAQIQQRQKTVKEPTAKPAVRELVHIPNVSPLPTMNGVVARINVLLNTLQESHAQHQSQISQAKADLEVSKRAEIALRKDISRASDRYTYFQEFKTYVNDLAEFLDDKFRELESLEAEYHRILLEQSTSVASRRDVLLDDWLSDFSSFVSADAEGMEARKAAYAEKHARRMALQTASSNNEASTDDEADEGLHIPEQKDIARGMHKLLFADTLDEFCSIPIIKSKFENWKFTFRHEYDQSFGGLSMPGVFELFVRHELLAWEPFNFYLDLEKMNWHEALMGYGMDPDAMEVTEDEDVKLLSKIVEKVVIPRMIARVELYDPFSSKQTNIALRLVGQMLNYTESDSKPFKSLVTAFEVRIDSVVSGIVEGHDMPSIRLHQPLSESALTSYNTWFATLSKLYGNAMLWKRYIDTASLQNMTVNKLLNRHLLPILRDSPSPCYELSVGLLGIREHPYLRHR